MSITIQQVEIDLGPLMSHQESNSVKFSPPSSVVTIVVELRAIEYDKNIEDHNSSALIKVASVKQKTEILKKHNHSLLDQKLLHVNISHKFSPCARAQSLRSPDLKKIEG